MSSALRSQVYNHVYRNADCMPTPAISKFADEASRLHSLMKMNQSLVENGRTGDTEQFYKRDGLSIGYKCGGCDKLFDKASKATKHIGNVEICRGSHCTEVACRETLFGTLCPPLSNYRRRVITPIPMAASFDAVDFPPPASATASGSAAPTAAAPTAAEPTAPSRAAVHLSTVSVSVFLNFV